MSLSIFNGTIRNRLYGNVGFGNTLQVDPILGDDSKGAVNQSPYKTINAAIAAAVSGNLILLSPGTYTETIILPSGVSMSGYSTLPTIITFDATSNTDLVTLTSNNFISNVTLKLTSSGHFQLRALVFPNSTAANSKIFACVITVDNSSASSIGTSNVYAVHSNGTSSATPGWQAMITCTIQCTSIGSGNKRGILCDTGANSFLTRNCNFTCTGTGSGTFYGAETNNSGAVARFRLALLNGTTSDCSSTLGQIQVGSCILQNSSTNNLPLYSVQLPQMFIFADPGSLQSNVTIYMRPGTATATTTPVYVRIPQNSVCRAISLQSVTGPGSTRTDTFTVYKNNVATSVTSSLTGAATSNYYQSTSVGFLTGDKLSVVAVTSGGTTTTDIVVSVEFL